MIPRQDDYPGQVRNVIARLLDGGREAALDELKPIAYPPRVVPGRPTFSVTRRLAIYQRDGWLCRYCGGQTILAQVMALLGGLFPEVFPYHTNWKTGATHPAIISRSASVDHVHPGTLGGSWTEPDNLVTACWLCNVRKADLTLEQLGWKLRDVPETSEWDGLTGVYPALWKFAGRPERGHHAWISALRRSS